MMLTAAYWVDALLLACLAVVFAVVLVDANGLLRPVQFWCHTTYRNRTGRELGEQWWWQPLWGCSSCISGQWAFWGYLLLFTRIAWAHHLPYLAGYSLLAHLGFTAITIILSILVRKWIQE